MKNTQVDGTLNLSPKEMEDMIKKVCKVLRPGMKFKGVNFQKVKRYNEKAGIFDKDDFEAIITLLDPKTKMTVTEKLNNRGLALLLEGYYSKFQEKKVDVGQIKMKLSNRRGGMRLENTTLKTSRRKKDDNARPDYDSLRIEGFEAPARQSTREYEVPLMPLVKPRGKGNVTPIGTAKRASGRASRASGDER